jgi:hypothetical protein
MPKMAITFLQNGCYTPGSCQTSGVSWIDNMLEDGHCVGNEGQPLIQLFLGRINTYMLPRILLLDLRANVVARRYRLSQKKGI